MQIINFLNISQNEKGEMILPLEPQNLNYIETMHAAAQFALAETASGWYLKERFPEYRDKIIGVVRKSSLRFRNAAETGLKAVVTMAEEEEKNLIPLILKRGRAKAVLNVALIDKHDKPTLEASFEWFLALNKE